jgi:phosphohistidine phosphatase SixA
MQSLVLLRHGTPLDEAVDAARPLSEVGLKEAEHAANGIAAYLELPSEFLPNPMAGEPARRAVTVVHSGKARAVRAKLLERAVARPARPPRPPCTGSPSPRVCAPIARAQAQTADCVAKALTAAGCDVRLEEAEAALAPNADPSAALAMLKAPAALAVVVGHLPHLHLLAGALGSAVAATAFTPAGGVVLEMHEGAWAVAHVVAHKKSWWIQGASQYVPAEPAE